VCSDFYGSYWSAAGQARQSAGKEINRPAEVLADVLQWLKRPTRNYPMRPGDPIAVKASYTRKHKLPFDNRGEFVSVLGIKAVGTITKNVGDGQLVQVDWAPHESFT
jgi:hypothetical protein